MQDATTSGKWQARQQYVHVIQGPLPLPDMSPLSHSTCMAIAYLIYTNFHSWWQVGAGHQNLQLDMQACMNQLEHNMIVRTICMGATYAGLGRIQHSIM